MMNYCYEYFSCRYLSFLLFFLLIFMYFIINSSYCTALLEDVGAYHKKEVLCRWKKFLYGEGREKCIVYCSMKEEMTKQTSSSKYMNHLSLDEY